MPEHLKLAFSALFFVATGLFLLVMHGGMISRLFGVLALFMAVAGAIAAFQKSRGREFRDLFARSGTQKPVFTSGPRINSEIPVLTTQGLKQLDLALSVMSSFGIFAPEKPETTMLQEPVADYGEPVTVESVLHALDEANYYHPAFRKEQHDRNLAFISGDTEQNVATITEQILDLSVLCGAALSATDISIDISADGHTEVRLKLNSVPVTVAYEGFPKNLSTVLCVEIASRFYQLGTGQRLASLWSDQGMFVTSLQDGCLDDLNKALGKKLTAYANFGWLDQEQPFDRTSMPTTT